MTEKITTPRFLQVKGKGGLWENVLLCDATPEQIAKFYEGGNIKGGKSEYSSAGRKPNRKKGRGARNFGKK